MSGIQNKITKHFPFKETVMNEAPTPKKERQRSFSLPRINQGQKRDLTVRSPEPEVSINKMQKSDNIDNISKLAQKDNSVNNSEKNEEKEDKLQDNKGNEMSDIRQFMVNISEQLNDITQTNNTVLNKLGAIETNLSSLQTKVSSIELQCNENKLNLDKISAQHALDTTTIKDDISALKTEIQSVSDTQKHGELLNDVSQTNFLHTVIVNQYKVLKQDIKNQKEYTQRYNLIFEKIPEKRNENPVLEIDSLLFRWLHLPNARFEIDKAHRMGTYDSSRRRPIIVKFKTHRAKEVVYSRRKMLKGTGIFINLHLTDEHQRESALLDKVARYAQNSDPSAKRQGDKIWYKHKLCTLKELSASDLSIHNIHQRENESVVGFLGQLSPLSNFFRTDLLIEGRKYENVEKYFQSKKAEMYGDMQTMSEILLQEDPVEIKKLSKRIARPGGKPLVRDMNAEVKIMHTALKAKFNKPELKTFLLATANKSIVECSSDQFWGCGLGLQDPEALVKAKWKGQNKLGQLISSIRGELK